MGIPGEREKKKTEKLFEEKKLFEEIMANYLINIF